MKRRKIYLKDQGKYITLEGRPISDEDELQRLLADHPHLVPSNLDERKVVAREFPTRVGPIDHLLLDVNGELQIIETKLARNTGRREVVGQVIDYASQLYRFAIQEFLDTMRRRVGYDFTQDWFSSRDEREEFLRNLENNLRSGRLTLSIVMDQADELLQDVVRFLNRSTEFTLILAELSVADAGGQEIVSVEIYGDESAQAKTTKSTTSSKRAGPIEAQEFIDELSNKGLEVEARAYIAALDWARDQGADVRSTRKGMGIGTMSLSWNVTLPRIEVWAYTKDFKARRDYLATATQPWRSRMTLRDMPPDRKYAKVAEIEIRGASESEIRQLLDFYLQGP